MNRIQVCGYIDRLVVSKYIDDRLVWRDMATQRWLLCQLQSIYSQARNYEHETFLSCFEKQEEKTVPFFLAGLTCVSTQKSCKHACLTSKSRKVLRSKHDFRLLWIICNFFQFLHLRS